MHAKRFENRNLMKKQFRKRISTVCLSCPSPKKIKLITFLSKNETNTGHNYAEDKIAHVENMQNRSKHSDKI